MSTETDELASAVEVEQKDVPPLPNELHHQILLIALPRLSFDTFKERYELLRAASLVSKAWRRMALRELIRHPYFQSIKQERKFMKAVWQVYSGFTKWGGKSVARGKVESLWIGDCHRWRENMKVGSTLPCAVEVWMQGGSAEPVVIHPIYTALYVLGYVRQITLAPAVDGQHHFALQTLATSTMGHQQTLSNVADVASLRCLILLEFLPPRFPDWHDFIDPVKALLSGLVSFVLEFHPSCNGVDDVPAWTSQAFPHLQSIRHLDVTLSGDNSQLMPLLPLLLDLPISAELTTLHVRPPGADALALCFSIILTTIKASPPALRNLKRLILPPPFLTGLPI